MTASVEKAEIGRRMREARVARGLSQGQLGVRMGVDRSTIAKYETGDRTPDLAEVRNYAKNLHVTAAWLIGEQSNERFDDHQVAIYYNSLPEYMKPVAQAMLKTLHEQADRIIRIVEDRRPLPDEVTQLTPA